MPYIVTIIRDPLLSISETLPEQNMSDTNCFDPRRSNFNPDALAAFIRAPIIKELRSIPGVGPKNKEILQNNGIFTTHQFMGKFLSLSEEETDCVELCDKFYFWLQLIGVHSHRGAIITALGEKLAIIVPGIYDSEIYEEADKDTAIEIENEPEFIDETESESEISEPEPEIETSKTSKSGTTIFRFVGY